MGEINSNNRSDNINDAVVLSGNTVQQAASNTTGGTYTVVTPPKKEDTPETKHMKNNFKFFGLGTLLYACFYAFCMYRNGSGITFPFFMAGSLLFLCFSLDKLTITLRKGSFFYMMSMMLLSVATFCTDDWKIINLNKTAIFLLMMSLLLHQFYDTSKWNLGKYLGSICELVFMSLGEMGRPFTDGIHYYKTQGKKNKIFWNGVLGVVIAVPLLLIVVALLSAADALFRNITTEMFDWVQPENIFNVLFMIVWIFFASYMLTAFLCKRTLKEEVKDKCKGEPILAITITGLLSLIYILFSGIQIFGLFLGKMQLPEDYTYAMYAREGFFQLLAVSVLNLIIVLCAMSYFKESKILKVVLTVMSLCTFVMIVSSAMRMIIYIRYYYMTFLRIFVLWALVVLFLLFVGVIISIYREAFPLFRYSVAVITMLYLVLAFSRPDYIVAKINVANAVHASVDASEVKELQEDLEYGKDFFSGPFFLGEYYTDYDYLSELSADAAPVLIPYLAELGYDLSIYQEEDILDALEYHENFKYEDRRSWRLSGFGYYYLDDIKTRLEEFSVRTYNISRHMALLNLEKYSKEVDAGTIEANLVKIPDITVINGTGITIEQLQYSYQLADDGLKGYDNAFEIGFYLEAEESITLDMAETSILKAELPAFEIKWKVLTGNDKFSVEEPMKADADGKFADTYMLVGDVVNGFALTAVSE